MMTNKQLDLLKILSMPEKWIYVFINQTNDFEIVYVSDDYDEEQYFTLSDSHRILMSVFLSLFSNYDSELSDYKMIQEMIWLCRQAMESPNMVSHLVTSELNGGFLWSILQRYSSLILNIQGVSNKLEASNFREISKGCGFDIKERKVNHFDKLIHMFWLVSNDRVNGEASAFYYGELERRLKSEFQELIKFYELISMIDEDIPISSNLSIISIDHSFLVMDLVESIGRSLGLTYSFFPFFKEGEMFFGVCLDSISRDIFVFDMKYKQLTSLKVNYLSFINVVLKDYLDYMLSNSEKAVP